MKILTLNYEFPPVGGGAAPVAFELCRQMVRLGHEVDVVTMQWKDSPAYEVIEGIQVHRTPALRGRPDICRPHEMASFLLGATGPALRLAADKKPDIIHCHFIIPTSPLAKRISNRFNIPYVVTCHGSDVPGYNPDRFKFLHVLLSPVWKGLVRRPEGLVSPSRSLRDLIVSLVPGVEVNIIPNGIEYSVFASEEKRKRILFCSRLLPRKGLGLVFEALEGVENDWEIDVIGDGPDRARLTALAERLKLPVHFHGWLNNTSDQFHELFATAGIFVFPSSAENFPTVLLEAMSSGCAIVTSTAGGCPEAVGDAAVLIDPNDKAGLREKLLYLMESETQRTQLSSRALERVKQFGWDHIAGRYIELFEEVIGRA